MKLLYTDRLLVQGGVDLASEKIEFKIVPRAKEASLVNLLVPIKIEGRLAELDVYAYPAGRQKRAQLCHQRRIGLSEIIGSIVSGLSGSSEENMCAAANSTARKATRSSAKNKRPRKASNEGENMFGSISDGLKSVFSR